RLLGSPRILSGWRTAALPNTGTSYKTKRQKRNRRAACQCLAITSLADVPATAYQRRDCGPVGLGRLHEPCDGDRRGRSHCGANRVPDRRKVFLVPSPEFHASMIFPEQALWQDRPAVAGHSSLFSRSSNFRAFSGRNGADALNVNVVSRKLGKFFRMQYSRQNFDAVDNARPWPCEVSTRIDEINVAAARRWKRIESRKFFQQFVIAARKIDIIAAEREHDNVRARIQHLLPIDLRRRLMLAA